MMKLLYGMVFLLALAACGVDERADTSDLNGFYVQSAIWPNPTIEVCWEPSSGPAPLIPLPPQLAPLQDEYAFHKDIVKTKVKNTFEGFTSLRFVGWGTCTANSKGIRIRTVNYWPATFGLGRYLDGRSPGMVFSFDFKDIRDANGVVNFANCRPSGGVLFDARNRACIENYAVHEFGHAVGLAHEHLRGDTPSTCTKPKVGTVGDVTVGSWDINSVMNYCNPLNNNGGKLSAGDIATLKKMYPLVPASSSPTSPFPILPLPTLPPLWPEDGVAMGRI